MTKINILIYSGSEFFLYLWFCEEMAHQLRLPILYE